MSLEITLFQLDPMENNTYLVADSATGQAVVIDPSFNSQVIFETVRQRRWELNAIWLTHAHFDHIAGINALLELQERQIPIGLHADDLPLYRQSGGAKMFGIQLDPGPEPELFFTHGQVLTLGEHTLEVRHTPGHCPGHVVFYSADKTAVFCGDLIFFRGVGRTDLPGGNHAQLLHSIREQIFTLPGETRILPGHGPESNVKEEIAENPFL